MIFVVLVLLTQCRYVEITSSNVDTLIGGADPILVKFYTSECPWSNGMAQDFADAARAFSDVYFGGVECDRQPTICEANNISNVPTILFFSPGDTFGTEYLAERTAPAFCEYIENVTHIKAKRPKDRLPELNPLTFYDVVNRTKCLFAIFYTPWCSYSQKFLWQASGVADAMTPEKDVLIALLNCEEYRDFCRPFVPSYPTVKLFINGENISYESDRSINPVIKFINQHCGTERGDDGLLSNEAGIIPEASELVKQFNEADNETKPDFLNKMKAIPNATFYVTVMERYLKQGVDKLLKDNFTMNKILQARNGSWPALDGMKRRLNVFAEYLRPWDPTPFPTPIPTPTLGPLSGTVIGTDL